MAKGDRGQLNKDIKTERNTVNQQYGGLALSLQDERNKAINRSDTIADFMQSGYTDLYGRSGLPSDAADRLRAFYKSGGGGGGGGDSVGGTGGTGTPSDPFGASRAAFANFINSGGVDIGAMKEALGGYRTMAESGGYSPEERARITSIADRNRAIGETGGFDPAQLALIRGDINTLRGYGQTGGIDAEGLRRARGGGVFDEFAQTGGYTPQAIQDIRSRSISPIAAQYAADKRNMESMNAVQGGYSPNYAASMARLSRNRGLASSDAARNAEIDIQGQVREGRRWGGEQMSKAENTLQEFLTRNKINATQFAGQGAADLEAAIVSAKLKGNEQEAKVYQQMLEDINKNKLGALGGITTTQQGAEEIAQRGKIAGAQGMFGVESATQAAAEAAAARAAAAAESGSADARWWANFGAGNERWLAENMMRGQFGALEGLGGLRGQVPGEVNMYNNALLNTYGGRAGNVLGGLQVQQANVGQPWYSSLGNIMGGIGSALPAIGKWIPGLGGGGGLGNPGAIDDPMRAPSYWTGGPAASDVLD